MDITIILIAIALAMDSFSVSITRGFTNTKTKMAIEALKAKKVGVKPIQSYYR